jgi:hypothetical protein
VVQGRKKFTLEEYHRLGETGFLGEDDRSINEILGLQL